MTAFTLYQNKMSQVQGRDPAFLEAIDKNMQIPKHLSVGPGPHWQEGEVETPPPAYTMQVPDRLTYTAPDMSPRPLFTPSKSALGLEQRWEDPAASRDGDPYREIIQTPIRRSYSDQSFGRTPPGTPTQLKQALAQPRHPSSFSSGASGSPPHQRSSVLPPQVPPPFGTPLSLLSPQSMLQAATQLGLQASQHLLQTVSQKYRFRNQVMPPPPVTSTAQPAASARVEGNQKRAMESWSPEEGATAVEFIVLRRQVMKMSRRLAALERHSAELRNTEVVLFSLLISACLLNAWLWMRR
ncbi:mitochondrial fission factor isoform X2 [Thalassophryne amazonica]|uniref:mitochondrial fission factor isoform X2 n=1 Tax=Thalassophryne amazonica TaxID=390379 RepID=UPI0014724D18|nr:mitochondrial fission factor isoform X2 [Thalassophryne amazonica]